MTIEHQEPLRFEASARRIEDLLDPLWRRALEGDRSERVAEDVRLRVRPKQRPGCIVRHRDQGPPPSARTA